MMKRRTSCAALVLILLALGAYAYLRPAALPAEAQASVDAYVQRCQGHTFDYRIVSAEKAARTIAGNVEDVVFFSGQVKWPSGIHAPNSPGVQDNWCVILVGLSEHLPGAKPLISWCKSVRRYGLSRECRIRQPPSLDISDAGVGEWGERTLWIL
jgi:hypothetical protein